MKNTLRTIALTLFCVSANAQSLQIKDLLSSLGAWEGKLTYMDYSTGKPFTMFANIKISLTEDKTGYIMGYAYPKEPHANFKDTIFVTNNLFGKEKMIDFKKATNDGFTLVTEIEGEDGNEHQKATLRHT